MITWKRDYMPIADYHAIPTIIVREKPMVKKQGLSDYYITCFEWYGEMRYNVFIDAMWYGNYQRDFGSLKEAWKYLKSKIG